MPSLAEQYGLTTAIGGDWSSTYRRVLADVLTHGQRVQAGDSLSVGSSRSSLELLNYLFEVADPLDRILHRGRKGFNLAAAIGRFVWMMTGSNRLEEIKFYDHRADRFSDDGYSVPGSSDGARLFNPRPGLNQIDRIVDVLRSDHGTRRGLAVIYHPEDAGRLSRDVPCHIGVAYNIRDGALHASTVMRSCNAARVLPYDFFLFSLLAEVVAALVGCPLGPYHQFTVSMHIYVDDEQYGSEVLRSTAGGESTAMPMMPAGNIREDLQRLAEAERYIRQRMPFADHHSVLRYSQELYDRFDLYWCSFAQILLLHAVTVGDHKVDVDEIAATVQSRVFPSFHQFLAL